jgi:hypothetical protein
MKILDITFNDLTRSFRSVFAIGMMVVAPMLLTGLIYFAFGSMSGGDVSMTAIKVGVVNADRLSADSMLDTPLGDNIRSMRASSRGSPPAITLTKPPPGPPWTVRKSAWRWSYLATSPKVT